MAEVRVVTDDGSPAPSGLVDAVLGYEAALTSGDLRALEGFFERGGHTARVDGTGVACYPTHALGAAELVHQASVALDEARSRGRDRVELAPEAS